MVFIPSLWVPILLAAALVFVASSIIHMFLGYHRSDFGPMSAEDEVMATLRKAGIRPGEYVFPHAPNTRAMSAPAYQEKMKRGPVGLLTIAPGPPAMGRNLTLWFVYCVAVSVFVAYVTGRALPPGTEYLPVFRLAGTTAFLAYAVALWQNSIWYWRSWGTTMKNTFDGLVYALLTAGAFGWLWPPS